MTLEVLFVRRCDDATGMLVEFQGSRPVSPLLFPTDLRFP